MAMNLLKYWRTDPTKKAQIRGLVRVACYFGVLGIGSAFFTVRSARAQVAQEGLELGRQLSQRMQSLAGPGQHEVNKLRVNGQPIYVASTTTKDAPKDVLERFAGYCAQNLAQSPQEWNGLADEPGAMKDAKVSGEAGIIRAGSDTDGMVMCFAKGKEAKAKLSDAVQAFAETGDLSALGELRYAYVHSAANGKTSVLTAWTHERFSVKELVAQEGVDAPGQDFTGLPRPQGSWRMFSATSEGTGYAVNVYRTDASGESVAELYDKEMLKLGWTGGEVTFDPNEPNAAQKKGLAYGKEGALLTVGIRSEDGKTYVAVGYAGASSGMRATAP